MGTKVKKGFGAYMRNLRRDRGMTLRQVEEKAGISNAYLSQVEREVRGTPGWKMLQRLAVEYGVPVDELVKAATELERLEAEQAPTTPDARFVVDQYQKLSESGKRELQSFLRYLVDKDRKLARQVLK